MALRDGEVAHTIRFYPERVRSGGGPAFEPQRSARSALSHRASVPNRSRRSDPEHLQFRDARSTAGSGRRENSFAGRNETFETIISGRLHRRDRRDHEVQTNNYSVSFVSFGWNSPEEDAFEC